MDNEENMIAKQYSANEPHDSACGSMPDLTRMRYFHGQMLAANDLQTEQDYFQEKLRLHNRCLHGYGTVCGLKVVEVKGEPDCDPVTDKQSPQPPACVHIECGMALDCAGNEIVLPRTLAVDVWDKLSAAEKNQIEKAPGKKATLYLSICYCVQPLDPVRPIIPDACGVVSECVYSKLRDSVRVKVSLERPPTDHCRNNCCEKCKDKCLLLAAIDFEKGKTVTDAQIRNDVRRWVSLYEPVTITGINWYQGGAYTSDEARVLLQRDGLVINFSRPVLTETITDGVLDVWVIDGGGGRSGNIWNMHGKLDLPTDSNGAILPITKSVKFRQRPKETLNERDRVLVTLRTDFILDECCRPVDGNHVGGRVPYVGNGNQRHRLRNGDEIEQRQCLKPPQRYGPWVSGNGSAGDHFESWFYIKNPKLPDEDTGTTDQY